MFGYVPKSAGRDAVFLGDCDTAENNDSETEESDEWEEDSEEEEKDMFERLKEDD
ncbi:MAG: hypothetical protein U5J64_10260 [Halobacteriales archaeon]|nr:hypothetical protein [Halobacteriales archaeon]